jgi:hypothetical protein
MRRIYSSILERLQPLVKSETLRWIDWDTGQLKKVGANDRPPVAWPCALIRIGIPQTKDITDKVQECRASVTITLAFDPLSQGSTAANAPEEVREEALTSYDVISKVYEMLQGFGTKDFDCLVRRSQGEVSHNSLFVYQIVFDCRFVDRTAQNNSICESCR